MKEGIDQHAFVDDKGIKACAFCFDGAGHADGACADDDEIMHGAKLMPSLEKLRHSRKERAKAEAKAKEGLG